MGKKMERDEPNCTESGEDPESWVLDAGSNKPSCVRPGSQMLASKFFPVQHEFRIGTSEKWWQTAQLAMAPRVAGLKRLLKILKSA